MAKAVEASLRATTRLVGDGLLVQHEHLRAVLANDACRSHSADDKSGSVPAKSLIDDQDHLKQQAESDKPGLRCELRAEGNKGICGADGGRRQSRRDDQDQVLLDACLRVGMRV